MKNNDKRKINKSSSQVKERNRFATLNIEWSNLSYEQKIGWFKLSQDSSIKRSGSNKKLIDGQLLFLSYNGFLQEIGMPINKDVPELKQPQLSISFNLEATNNDGKREMLFHLEDPIQENSKVILYASGPLKTGTPKIDERYLRKISVIDSEFVSGSSILARYLLVFKEIPQKGQVMGFKALPINKECGKPGLGYAFPFVIQ